MTTDPFTADPATADPATGDPATGDPVTGDPVTSVNPAAPPRPRLLRVVTDQWCRGGWVVICCLVCCLFWVATGCGGSEGASPGETTVSQPPGPAGEARPAVPPSGRIVVLGMDGLDPTELGRRVAAGELPTFARMMEEGAYGPLESAYPLLSPILWTTLATGRHPLDHGVSDFTVTNPTTGAEVPVTSSVRRVPALWNLFSEAETEVGVVGWWATWPSEPVRGVMVSDRVGLHFLLQDRVVTEDLPALTFPEAALARVRASMVDAGDVPHEVLARFTSASQDELDAALAEGVENDLSHLAWAVATALSYRDVGLDLLRDLEPRLLLVYFEITDTLAHLFGHLHLRDDLAGELAQQQQRYGNAVTAAYDLADEILAAYVQALGPDDLLLVVSDHGFRLGALQQDPSVTRAEDMRRVSDAFHELHGVLLLQGAGVAPGSRLKDADIFDFAPTVMAAAGLVPSEEMPGRVLVEAFEHPLPLQRVASYADRNAEEATSGGAVDDALMEKLRSLGYVGGASGDEPIPTRNLAAIALEEGRYREAARAYNRLLAESPDDGALHADLSAALMGLGRTEQALASAMRAVDLAPAQAIALLRRAQVYEELGRREDAVADYREALRYQPDHRPSRRALERLGEAVAATATSPAQLRAQELLDIARDAVQRGEYDGALAALAEAETLVPNAAIVFQYRANVYFLQGNREAAAADLRRALELDPTNAQLRDNLRRLGAETGAEGG